MSEQDDARVTTLQRPTNNDREAWRAYWEAQGQSWRTEPEIDEERQKFLNERRSIIPHIEQGIYPFKDIKLNRADIEWLLATFENGRGPVHWNAGRDRSRNGLDLRGADLRGVDLQGLPLSRMQGGLTVRAWDDATSEQREMAAVHLEGASLSGVHLNDAFLRSAHFEGANFHWAYLEGASLRSAHLEGASLRWGRLRGAYLQEAYLQGADLHAAQLERANLKKARLAGANLELAFFDSGTNLSGISLESSGHEYVSLADVRWGDANLAVVDWKSVRMLGDEYRARQKERDGKGKDRLTRLNEFEAAVRANRQLAIALQAQGINEQAARFAYRAQQLQRKVFRLQREFGSWIFSTLLALLSGYGYRIWRILAASILMVSLFAISYFVLGFYYLPHLTLAQAFLESITAFHGRVFLEQFTLNTPQIWVTALEAVTGLVIEGVFIAMLVQRFFGKCYPFPAIPNHEMLLRSHQDEHISTAYPQFIPSFSTRSCIPPNCMGVVV